jgi:hypothetical protein
MVGLDGFYTILDIVGRTEWRLWLSALSTPIFARPEKFPEKRLLLELCT